MADDKGKDSKPKGKSKEKVKSSSNDEWIIIIFAIVLLIVGGSALVGVTSIPSFVSMVSEQAEKFSELPVVHNTILAWKIIAGIISIASIGVMLLTIFLSMQFRVHVSTKKLAPVPRPVGGVATVGGKVVRTEWLQFLDRAAKVSPTEARMLVIEADSIADIALQRLGFVGEDMGDRMKSIDRAFPHLERFWELHKLRNNLAHNPGMLLEVGELEKAIHSYHYILMELGAI